MKIDCLHEIGRLSSAISGYSIFTLSSLITSFLSIPQKRAVCRVDRSRSRYMTIYGRLFAPTENREAISDNNRFRILIVSLGCQPTTLMIHIYIYIYVHPQIHIYIWCILFEKSSRWDRSSRVQQLKNFN